MAGLGYTVSQLENALRLVRQQWEAAQAVWNDPVRREFERLYWTTLEQQTVIAHREMAKLATVLTQAQQAVR